MEINASGLFTFPLSEEEKQIVDECIPVRTYAKGTVLLEEGRVATECYFNVKGLVRCYYLIDGEEKTTQFYTEGDSICSLTSYLQRTPAPHYLACIETSTLAVLSYEKEQELFQRFPKFESLCRLSMESNFGDHQHRMDHYLITSPEQRYLHLQATQPALVNRVPQYLLASYLGIKPESLSRIRKRVALKH